MAEYIEREALIEKLNEAPTYFDSGDIRYGIEIAIDQTKKQPTADVVKVVRCKNCTHFIKRNEKPSFCFLRRRHIKENDFCSDGELKEREG